MIFTLMELFDIVIMTLVLGFVFKDIFKPKKLDLDPLEQLQNRSKVSENFKFAMMLTAPAIILHELGHKFVAMSFGLQAEFNAAYIWLGIALVLALMKSNFIFFVPAYVSISPGPKVAMGLAALAGPLVNATLWLTATLLLKYNLVPVKYQQLMYLTAKINMFLFIFNILPIPGFDGYHVLNDLIL